MSEKMFKDLFAMSQAGRWEDIARLTKKYIAKHRFFVPHMFLVEALIHLGQLDEADSEFEDLISYKFNLADRLGAVPAVAERYRGRLAKHYVMSTMGGGATFEQIPLSPADGVQRWELPSEIENRAQYVTQAQNVFDLHFGDVVNATFVQSLPFRGCVTFGSCFAANLAKKFNEKGFQAKCLLIEESVNSTYANRLLLDVAAGVLPTSAHREMLRVFGDDFFNDVRKSLSECSHVVVTVGVAPSFFDKQTNEFVFAGRYGDLLRSGSIYMRTTTVDENKCNLRHILNGLSQLAPTARVFVTVSPVPLAATAELPSALIADCVSKATLRAAVHEVFAEERRAAYFPAFEVVRWLAGHTSLSIFGGDDGNSRHISNWVVDFIVAEFERRFIARGD